MIVSEQDRARLSALPVWAQRLVTRLEYQVEKLEDELTRSRGALPLSHVRYRLPGHMEWINLPERIVVRFCTADRQQLDVTVESGHEDGGFRLVVGRRIRLMPVSSNTLYLMDEI